MYKWLIKHATDATIKKIPWNRGLFYGNILQQYKDLFFKIQCDLHIFTGSNWRLWKCISRKKNTSLLLGRCSRTKHQKNFPVENSVPWSAFWGWVGVELDGKKLHYQLYNLKTSCLRIVITDQGFPAVKIGTLPSFLLANHNHLKTAALNYRYFLPARFSFWL